MNVVVDGTKFIFLVIFVSGYDTKQPRHEVRHVYTVDSRGVPREANTIVLIALNVGGDVNVAGHDSLRYGRNETVSIDVPARNYAACLIRLYDEVAMTNVIV